MKKLDNKEKINLIKKFYKKEKAYIELSLINYEGYNIYITLNYNKKNDSYKLRWFDLSEMVDLDIDKYMSCSYILNSSIKLIEDDFSNFVVSSKYENALISDQDVVELKANIKTKVDNEINVKFNKYLPISLGHLLNLIIFLFENMPKHFEKFLWEIMANFTNTTEKYEYKKEFEFNLFEGNIDNLFRYQIVQRGEKYYEEERIIFLEKIDDRYFAVVDGSEDYVVIIKYNEEQEMMQVYCSCPCEFYCKHICAVILAIRNKKFNRFYKIMYKNPNKNMLERIMEFEYSLCLGILEQNFEIINNYGQIELIPILDINGEYNWEVLEDSDNEQLMKEIKYFFDNNKQ